MTSARPSSAQVRQVYEQMRIARQDVARCDLELSHQMKTVLAKMRLYFKERKKMKKKTKVKAGGNLRGWG